MELPKPRLSYSAINLWEKSKPEFRKRYYENQKTKDTPEIIFGRTIGKLLEKGPPYPPEYGAVLERVPRLPVPEHKIEINLGEVPFIGYLDGFDPADCRILEYKTGRAHPDGSPRWTQYEVEKTDQLPIYSLLIKEKYGRVHNHTRLCWMRTRFTLDHLEFAGHTLTAASSVLELDGHVETFERIIYEWERQKIKEKIIRCAHEIEDDYKKWKNRSEGLGILSISPEETKAHI